MKKIILLTAIIFLAFVNIHAQYKDALKTTFYDAEYYMLYEDYNEALALYLTLIKDGFDNAYIQHRIGECYLNIPGQKNKSIPFLEKACEDVADNHKRRLHKRNQSSCADHILSGMCLSIEQSTR